MIIKQHLPLSLKIYGVFLSGQTEGFKYQLVLLTQFVISARVSVQKSRSTILAIG
jgi:hypothetical protein